MHIIIKTLIIDSAYSYKYNGTFSIDIMLFIRTC